MADERLAASLRGFGLAGILSFFVILLGNLLFLPLSALLVLLWARLSDTPWRALGFARPRSWVKTIAIGVVFGASFKLVMKALVMPLLGADPINHAYRYLTGNPAALPAAIYMLVIGAGFGEETVYRGYLFERLGALWGRSITAKVATVISTAALFGLAHFPGQGLSGAEQATIVGLVVGAIMAVTGQLWLLMITHAAFDLTALALIYWDLETRVAHWVFR